MSLNRCHLERRDTAARCAYLGRLPRLVGLAPAPTAGRVAVDPDLALHMPLTGTRVAEGFALCEVYTGWVISDPAAVTCPTCRALTSGAPESEA
jgi:hypothetical protein